MLKWAYNVTGHEGRGIRWQYMKGWGIRGAIEEGWDHMSCGLMSLALQALVDGWCEPLLKMCEDYLSSVVLCTPGRREGRGSALGIGGSGRMKGGKGKERTIGRGEEEVGRGRERGVSFVAYHFAQRVIHRRVP